MGYIVRKLNAVPSTAAWLAVRLSYGMNGILIPVKNLPSLIGYMRRAPCSPWAFRGPLTCPRCLPGTKTQ